MKSAACLITTASIIQVLGYWYALPGHLGDPTWSAHAQFHLVEAFLWITGLDLAINTLAWGPLQKKERWSFWTLLALFLFAQGSHFLSSMAVPRGRPAERWYDWALGLVALIYAIGLAIGWRKLYRSAVS